MPATDGVTRTAPRPAVLLPPIVGSILFASTIPALALGFFLLTRLVGGALASPLSASQLVATAAALCIWAAAVCLFAPPHSNNRLTIALPLCVVLLFAITCSYPGTRVIDWLVWPAAIAPLVAIHRIQSIATPPRGPGSEASTAEPATSTKNNGDSQTILQQLTRVRDANGRECIHGTLVAEFAPGERQTILFVTFCPPFERLPEVEVEIADDSSADVKLAQVLHHGAELEVRLPHPASSATSITVELFAAEPPPD